MPKTTKTKKTKPTNNKKTYVMLVIDRSGSMGNTREAVVKGINEQLRTLQKSHKQGGQTEVSILQFDDQFDIVTKDKSPDEIVEWTAQDFVPRGGTALRDALYRAISHLKTKEETDDTGYLISVISDGEENSSKEVTEQMLKDEISKLEATNKWTFSYLMSNIRDTAAFQSSFAVNGNNVAYYNSTMNGTYTATAANASSIGSYLRSRGDGLTSTADFYSEEQKTTLKSSK